MKQYFTLKRIIFIVVSIAKEDTATAYMVMEQIRIHIDRILHKILYCSLLQLIFLCTFYQ